MKLSMLICRNDVAGDICVPISFRISGALLLGREASYEDVLMMRSEHQCNTYRIFPIRFVAPVAVYIFCVARKNMS